MAFVNKSPYNRVNIIFQFPNGFSREPIFNYKVYIIQVLVRVSSVLKNAFFPRCFQSFSAKMPESRHYSMFTSIVTLRLQSRLPLSISRTFFLNLKRAQSLLVKRTLVQIYYLTPDLCRAWSTTGIRLLVKRTLELSTSLTKSKFQPVIWAYDQTANMIDIPPSTQLQ